MKRLSAIALLLTAGSVSTYVLAFAGPSSSTKTPSTCGCVECRCPDCNGESCSCDVCECVGCACAG